MTLLISRSHTVKKKRENQPLHIILQVDCGVWKPTHSPTQNKCNKRGKKAKVDSSWQNSHSSPLTSTSTIHMCTNTPTPITTKTLPFSLCSLCQKVLKGNSMWSPRVSTLLSSHPVSPLPEMSSSIFLAKFLDSVTQYCLGHSHFLPKGEPTAS